MQALLFQRKHPTLFAVKAGNLFFFGGHGAVNDKHGIIRELRFFAHIHGGKIVAGIGIVFQILNPIGCIAGINKIPFLARHAAVMGAQLRKRLCHAVKLAPIVLQEDLAIVVLASRTAVNPVGDQQNRGRILARGRAVNA